MKKKTSLSGKQKKQRLNKAAVTSGQHASKLMSPMQKARAVKKALTNQLKVLKADFKAKLQAATADAYAKALHDFEHNHVKKSEARQKVIAAAEAKFDKKYAKKTQRKSPNKSTAKVKSTPAQKQQAKQSRLQKAA